MKWPAWMLFACAWWSGCAGTETGNPSFDGTLGYDAYSTRPDQVALRASAITRVDSAWLVLGNVEFAAPGECGGGEHAEASVKGLGAGDHAATQAPATPFTLEEGNYCEVRVPLDQAATLPDGAPPELAGHSILIRGVLPDDRRFEIASAYLGRVTIRAIEPNIVLDRAQPSVVIGFDLAAWLGDIVWPSGAGEIRIDARNNPQLLQAFEARIAKGVSLFRDEDGDGELDIDPMPIARGMSD